MGGQGTSWIACYEAETWNRWQRQPHTFQVEGTACAKVLGAIAAWHVGRAARKPLWLEQSEGERQRRGGQREDGAGRVGRWGLGLLPLILYQFKAIPRVAVWNTA